MLRTKLVPGLGAAFKVDGRAEAGEFVYHPGITGANSAGAVIDHWFVLINSMIGKEFLGSLPEKLYSLRGPVVPGKIELRRLHSLDGRAGEGKVVDWG